jgi:hypothetical protein
VRIGSVYAPGAMRGAAMLQATAVTMAMAVSMLSSGTANAAVLALAGGAQSPRAISLDYDGSEKLVGHLDLLVRDEATVGGTLAISYFAEGDGTAAGPQAVSGAAQSISAGGVASIDLAAKLPSSAPPSDLRGTVRVQLVHEGHAIGTPVEVSVQGQGPTLQGIVIVPSKVVIGAVDWLGPFEISRKHTAKVELRGPTVPLLFRVRQHVEIGTRLQSSRGHEIKAELSLHPSASAPDVAEGTISVKGGISPGTYRAELPLTNLSAGGPAVSVEVKFGHGFIWALLAVLAGAILGGAVYLASGLRRRKTLLQQCLRQTLEEYLQVRKGLEESSLTKENPLWSTRFLGAPSSWFRGAWTALPDIEGVPGVWTELRWSRNESDLDEGQKDMEALLSRLRRWTRVAEPGTVVVLQSAGYLTPSNAPNKEWSNTKTDEDTECLLRELADTEPKDLAGADALLGRVERQARWHALFARAWHVRSTLENDMAVQMHADAVRLAQERAQQAQEQAERAQELAAQAHKEAQEQAAGPPAAPAAQEQATQSASSSAAADPPEETHATPEQSPPPAAGYDAGASALLETVKLEELDEKATPENERTPEQQSRLEVKLEDWIRDMSATFKGDPALLVVPQPAGSQLAVAVGQASVAEVRRTDSVHIKLAGVHGVGALQVSGEATLPTDDSRTPRWLRWIAFTDLVWSLLTVVVTLAVYVPTFFGPTWGTLGDYGSAFAAGFLGKVVINWAALPLYRSVLMRPKPAGEATTVAAQSPGQ